MEQNTIRAFIAIPLPQDVISELDDNLQKLRNEYAEVRWTEKHKWHITLSFLGNINMDRVAQLKEILQSVSDSTRPLEIEIESIETMFTENHPRIIGATVSSSEPLTKLYLEISNKIKERRIVETGFKRFQPHITLGRILHKNVLRLEPVNLNVKYMNEKVDLMKSELLSYGSKYSIIESFSFKNG